MPSLKTLSRDYHTFMSAGHLCFCWLQADEDDQKGDLDFADDNDDDDDMLPGVFASKALTPQIAVHCCRKFLLFSWN